MTCSSDDPICSRRELLMATYQVVPMTPRVGALEWVDNTIPLKAVIEKEASKRGLEAEFKL